MSNLHGNEWAHSAPVDQNGKQTGPPQGLRDHLEAVGRGTQDRLRDALGRHPVWGAWAVQAGLSTGLAHDIGKATLEFQAYLRGGSRAPHKMTGAVLARNASALECALAIAGHHGGLPDWDPFRKDHDEERLRP